MNYKKLTVFALMAFALAIGLSYGNRKASAASTLIVDDDLACTGATFTTIQAAVNVANPGDTIMVCPGTYNELVTVDRTLTILGAQSGVDARTRAVPVTSESVVGSGDGAFQIEADNVVIDGFTIQGVTNNPSAPPFTGLGAGIWSNPGEFAADKGGHQIRNNIIQNNIMGIFLHNDGTFPVNVTQNLISNNNAPGPGSGTGIDSEFGSSNMTIDRNKFVGNGGQAIAMQPASSVTMTNNEFDSNGRAFFLQDLTSSLIAGNNIHDSTFAASADVRIFSGVSGLAITCNTLTNGAGAIGRGIRINDGVGGDPNSNITINFNNISGYPVAGLEVNSGGYTGGPLSLNAKNDWWGSATGPTIASNPGGTGQIIVDPDGVVDYHPFLKSVQGLPCPPLPVTPPRIAKQQVLSDLIALRATVTDKRDRDKLHEAIKHLTKSLDPKLWIDDFHPQPKGGDQVFNEEKDTVNKLLDLIKDKHSAIPDATLQGFINRIVGADRLIALTAIGDAAGGDAKKLGEANKELAKGDSEAASGKPDNAIEHYRNAWNQALKA